MSDPNETELFEAAKRAYPKSGAQGALGRLQRCRRGKRSSTVSIPAGAQRAMRWREAKTQRSPGWRKDSRKKVVY